MKKSIFWLLLGLLIILPPSLAQNTPLKVVTTTTIIADVAKNVGGNLVDVESLVLPDADVHAFQPSPSDVALVAEADVVLVNGAGLESFLGDLVEDVATVRLSVISNGIKVIAGDEHNHEADSNVMSGHSEDTTGTVSAGYLTITNNGATADVLVSVTTEAAGRVQFHETVIENNMATMQHLEHGLSIPAGTTVALEPGGLHLMLQDIKRDLIVAETVDLTLNFASGTSIMVTALIGDVPPAETIQVESNHLVVSGAWVRPAAASPSHGHEVEYAGIFGVDTDCGDLLAHSESGHETGHEEHHDHGRCDPHFWTDPANVMVWTDNIAAIFAEADPANAAVYQAHAEDYKAQLTALDAEVEQILSVIPNEKRILVTNHEFLAYFAARYEFEIAGVVIPGGTTLAEPDPQELAALVQIINAEGVAAIFAEIASPGPLAQVVAQETERDIKIVTLYSDSLSAPAGPAGTYIDYMRHNATVIAAALGGL